jgi:P63C domain-containing protein
MEEKILKATHEGILTIGDKELAVAVLEDGSRIISGAAIFKAFGRTKRGRKKDEIRVLNMPSFIDANNLQPFISEDLGQVLRIIEYRRKNGRLATGYDVKILPLICDVYLSARLAGALTKQQLPLAIVSEMLVRSFSKIGIVALVDEVSGYQYDRERDDLERLLEIYLSEERLKWAKMFPDEFYKLIYKLKGWPYPTGTGKTPYIGRLTNQYVYEKLPPGVLPKLRELNPKNPITKRRPATFHQHLSVEIGQPDLRDHLLQVIALLRAAPNWRVFDRLFKRAFPTRDELQEQRQKFFPLPELEDDLIT